MILHQISVMKLLNFLYFLKKIIFSYSDLGIKILHISRIEPLYLFVKNDFSAGENHVLVKSNYKHQLLSYSRMNQFLH